MLVPREEAFDEPEAVKPAPEARELPKWRDLRWIGCAARQEPQEPLLHSRPVPQLQLIGHDVLELLADARCEKRGRRDDRL